MDCQGSREILSALSTSSIEAKEKSLGFFNKICYIIFLSMMFILWNGVTVCFAAFKLVIVLAWFS